MSFKDLIADSQDQGPTCKCHMIAGAENDKIKKQTERI